MFQNNLHHKNRDYFYFPFTLVFCLLFTSSFYAQKYDFNYFENEIFPQKYIYDITQDNNGLLLIATENGFIKYDGYSFEQITKDNGLAENFVYKIYIDKYRNIWLGHYQKGISLITKNKKVKSIQKEFSGARITSFVEDKLLKLIVSTDYKGIFLLDTNLNPQLLYKDKNVKTNSLLIINNQLLIATSNGLKVVNKTKDNLKFNFETATLLFNNENILKIIDDSVDNNILIITANSGIKQIKKSNNLDFTNYKQFATNIKINSACLGKQSNIWVGSNKKGLYSLSLKKNKTENLTHYGIKNGFNFNYVNSLYSDKENNLWIGSYGNGICQLTNQEYSLFEQNYFTPDHEIKAVEAGDDNIYIATKSTLYSIDTLNSVKKIYTGTKQSEITSLFFLNDSLWIGTGRGVYLLTEYIKINEINFLKNDCINSITGNEKGKIYFATNKGLVIFTNNRFRRLTTNEGMLHNTIKKVFLDKKNNLWIGTVQSPLYSIKNDTISIYRNLKGFNSMNINDIAEDDSNNIWLATHGDGIFKINKDSVQHYTTDNGLPSNYCYALCIDNNQTVWSGFQTGICYKSIANNNFNSLQYDQQFLSSKINLQTINSTKTGNVFFGSEAGLIFYQPGKNKKNETSLVPEILKVTVNSNPINFSAPIILSYNKNDIFSIYYRAIYFSNPKNITYKFRLKNYENLWHTVNYRQRSISYSGLSPGNYEFQITASSNNTYVKNTMVYLNFIIKPPFWKTNWFISSFITLIIILIFIFIRIREKNLAANQIHLEEQLKIRTNELMIHKNLIELKNRELTDSIKYAQTIQEAILHKNKISDYFLSSFIFFKPKNIVSGDFYWAAQIKDEIIIAAVDCTGHGVPGALMSIIGLTFLNEIIKIQNITNPKLILDLLDKKTIEILSFKGEKLSKDGMDIALIKFNKITKKLVFSGAGSPLILIRDQEIKKYRGALLGIGDSYIKNFENIEIDIIKGDKIYIFSDGYKDQFGYLTDTKLKNRGFMNILLKASVHEMNKQGNILSEEFLKWRGKNEQTDDVLVIGIEF